MPLKKLTVYQYFFFLLVIFSKDWRMPFIPFIPTDFWGNHRLANWLYLISVADDVWVPSSKTVLSVRRNNGFSMLLFKKLWNYFLFCQENILKTCCTIPLWISLCSLGRIHISQWVLSDWINLRMKRKYNRMELQRNDSKYTFFQVGSKKQVQAL